MWLLWPSLWPSLRTKPLLASCKILGSVFGSVPGRAAHGGGDATASAPTPSPRRRTSTLADAIDATRRDQATTAQSIPKKRKLFAPRRRVASAFARGIFVFVLYLRGKWGTGRGEGRAGFASPRVSSAVHSPSSRAYQSARQGEFSFVWSRNGQPRARPVFFFFVGGI